MFFKLVLSFAFLASPVLGQTQQDIAALRARGEAGDAKAQVQLGYGVRRR